MAEEMKWLPIESAPSGKVVLVYYKNAHSKNRIVMAKHIARFTEESESDCEGVDEYDEQNDRYTYVEGWWEALDNWDEYGFVKFESGHTPTHWMPLPPPPSGV